MSGLLEADIDLGLESGAAAFDPLYCSPPPPAAGGYTVSLIHHRNRLHHHRPLSPTPLHPPDMDIKRLVLAPFKVHVRFICLTSRPFADPCPPSLALSDLAIPPPRQISLQPPATPSLLRSQLSFILTFRSRVPSARLLYVSPLNSRDLLSLP